MSKNNNGNPKIVIDKSAAAKNKIKKTKLAIKRVLIFGNTLI